MIQTVCDRCNRVPGGYATIGWHTMAGWHEFPINKDLCKECFNALFPEWKEKEHKKRDA